MKLGFKMSNFVKSSKLMLYLLRRISIKLQLFPMDEVLGPLLQVCAHWGWRDECPRGLGSTERSCSWLCLGLACSVGPDNGEAPGGWRLLLTVPCTHCLTTLRTGTCPSRSSILSARHLALLLCHTSFPASAHQNLLQAHVLFPLCPPFIPHGRSLHLESDYRVTGHPS